MRQTIWAVGDGPDCVPFGFFSTKHGAELYVRTLVERYSLGKNLSLHGKQIASNAGAWSLGLGPTAIERAIDDPIDTLPGAWVVKVDETCRMVACEFSTAHRPTRSPCRYRTGIHSICEAYGMTPHAALDRARKGMVSYLASKPSWR
jgi:hypothetical protein